MGQWLENWENHGKKWGRWSYYSVVKPIMPTISQVRQRFVKHALCYVEMHLTWLLSINMLMQQRFDLQNAYNKWPLQTVFDASKSVLWSFFAFFAKIWPKNLYFSSKYRICLVWPYYQVTWDDLDLHYGHKTQEMILTNVSDTIRADSLALLALNIEILPADVTKTEIWNIPTLTRPDTISDL